LCDTSRRLHYFTAYSIYQAYSRHFFYSFSNERTAIFGCRTQLDIAINERTWRPRRRGRERWDRQCGQCGWWGCGRGHPLYARCHLYDTSGCSSREFYRGRDEDKRGERRGSDRAARHVSGNITAIFPGLACRIAA